MTINKKQNSLYFFSLPEGLNKQFILYFLLFAYVPLFVFSIVGYMVNKELLKSVYQKNLEQAHQKLNESIRLQISEHLRHSCLNENKSGWESGLLFIQSSYQGSRQVEYNSGLLPDEILLSDQIIPGKIIEYGGRILFAGAMSVDSMDYYFIADTGYLSNFLGETESGIVHYFQLQNSEVRLAAKSPKSADVPGTPGKSRDDFSPVGEDSQTQLSIRTPVIESVFLISFLDDKHIFDPLRNLLFQIIPANLLLGIFLLIIAVILARKVTSPLQALIRAAQRISQGEMSEPITIESRDEIQLLANEFERMRKKLLESYSTLELKIEERTKALRDAQFQISHQEKMASLGLMAAGIAHEIGNPLTSISSMAQLIKRKERDEVLNEYLNTILSNIDRISKIVRELVDFARPSNYETALFNINDIIIHAVNIVKYDRRARHLKIDLDLYPDLPPVFLVSDQILQVFLNILINAVDALGEDRRLISVKSQTRSGLIFIEFKDTGSGIPAENLNKIFEPFFTTKQVGKGTGLGLSVSYGIVKNFNGKINVESKPGIGSTFTVILPVAQPGVSG